MEHIILNFMPYLEHLNSLWYLIIFLWALLESIILIWYFIPWTTIILIFWMLSGLWYYSFLNVFIIAILWNIIWNIISFFIWRYFWKKVLKDWFYFIKPKYLQNAAVFINKYSGRSIFLWKLTPAIKENIPFVAWILKIKLLNFLFWDILWAIAWSLIYVWTWYIFSSSFNLAKIWIGRIGLFIIAIIVFIGLLMLLRIFLIKLWKYFISIFRDFIKYMWQKIIQSQFVKKYPKLFLFIENRFILNKFTWLPLTVFLWIFLYLISVLVWLTEITFDNSIMQNIDINTSHLMYYFYYPILVKIFLVISFFWNIYFIIISTFFIWIYLLLRRKINIFFSIFVTILSTWFITILVKFLIHRPRPELATYFVNSYSFPSFHSAISVSFYWFLVWLLIKKINKWNEKVNFIILFLFIIFIIGFARIYLNVHYVSDVLWWYLVGAIWLILWITIYEYIIHINKEKEKNYKNVSTFGKIIFVLVFIICSVSYFSYYFSHIEYLHPKQIEKTIEIKNIFNYLNKHPNLKYTETITWRRTEPINFIILAKNSKILINLFKKAWRTPADKITFDSIVKIWRSLYEKKSYTNAPMLPLYWNQRLQTFSFQKVDNPKNIRLRHHIRIRISNIKQWKYRVYMASAIYDDGIKWHITHRISPNIDKERNYTFKQLDKTWMIKSFRLIQLVKGYIGYNFSYDQFFTDGKAYVLKVEKIK